MTSEPRPGPFRVLFGDEDHLISLDLEKVRSGKNREVFEFYGEGLDARELVSFCEVRVSDPRGVIVDEAQKVKNGDVLLKFVEQRDPSDRSVVLLFAVRSNVLTDAWVKEAARKGRVVHYPKPKPWDKARQIGRIQAEAKRVGVQLEDAVPETMIRFLGYDLALIANELRKASYLVNTGGVVTKDIILSLMPQIFPARPHEVAEAAMAKKPRTAMSLLGFVYRNLGDGASIPVTYALMRLVEKLFVARSLTDQGASLEEVAERLEMHAYAYRMNLLPLVERNGLLELATKMKTLCRLDALVKGAASSKRTHVELAVLSLATS
jgi:DNA polymerase III delta subunit